MQFLHSSVHVGDTVRVRQQRWRVLDVRAHEKSAVVTIAGMGPENRGTTRQILCPVDDIEPVPRSREPRIVGFRRWQRAWRTHVLGHGPVSMLRTACSADIDLLPHQLEPAIAIVKGLGARVLLADEVGLGKTIQAGLILGELQARGAGDRVLILTPSGLREQWVKELGDRFGICAALVDGRFLRRQASSIPVGTNPWTTVPMAIASIDYAKRAEVLPAVQECRWDVLVVDEAHGISSGSDRYTAVSSLAARASYVLLLTGTPHNGDRDSFSALCSLGARGDRLLVFRRTRLELGQFGRRRIHRLRVSPTTPEIRMHTLLARLTAAARAQPGGTYPVHWLALTILHKRALSGAYALERTVRRRLASLTPGEQAAGLQLGLPLDESSSELDAADEEPTWVGPLLPNPEHERRLLMALADAARLASAHESKLLMLDRWLARLRHRGESAIVFTEFRDTLLHVRQVLNLPCTVLHGGLSRLERRMAIDDFSSGRSPILLATDAAGEGLNLHRHCRVVFNLELPWNPMRLAQRTGRVDRIGQRRTVHTFHLIARSTAEEEILARLRTRVAHAQDDIGAPNPLADEQELSRLIIDGVVPSRPHPATTPRPAGEPAYDLLRLPGEVAVEHGRLARARAMAARQPGLDRTPPDRTLISLSCPPRIRSALTVHAVVVLRTLLEDTAGRRLASHLTALEVRLSRDGRPPHRDFLTRLLAEVRRRWEQESNITAWIDRSTREHEAFWAMRQQRETSIGNDGLCQRHAPVQPHLFDQRVERALADSVDARRHQADDSFMRIAAAHQAAIIASATTDVVLALFPPTC